MVKLYENLQDNPDYQIPENIGWRECLGFFSSKQKLLQGEDEIEEIEEGGAGGGDLAHQKFEFERNVFNKMYEKIDKVFAKFLDTAENQELKGIAARWKNFMSEDISKLNLPDD